MKNVILVKHYKGAPGLRLVGLGPSLKPSNGLKKLKLLLDRNASWAKNRKLVDLRKCLAQSDVVISIWKKQELVGFGRALSDGVFRSVLWDIVIDKDHQGYGYGKIIVQSLLDTKLIRNTKRIYIMTSNKKDFYCSLDFKEVSFQDLLIKEIGI